MTWLEELWLRFTCTCEFEWRWTPGGQEYLYPDMCLRCGRVRYNGIVITVGKCWDEEKGLWLAKQKNRAEKERLGKEVLNLDTAEATIHAMTTPLRIYDYYGNVSVPPPLGRRLG